MALTHAPVFDRVGSLIEVLRSRLVPGCSAGAVAEVLALATEGSGLPRRRDGRRSSVLTPSGGAVEVSVTGGRGRSSAALRYTAEPGSASPFFGPRLAAQRRAVAGLAALLPSEVDTAADEVRDLHDVVFPDPGAVPARTRFASFVGVVHTAAHPDRLSGLKLYANLEAGGPGALARVASRWPASGELVAVVDGLAGAGGTFTLAMVAVETLASADQGPASADPGLRVKFYLGTRVPGPGPIVALADRLGADAAALPAALAAAGLDARSWRRPVVACLATDAVHGGAPQLSVHLPARALDLSQGEMASAARRVAGRYGAEAAVEALVGDVGGSRARAADLTVLGLGLTPTGIGKVNVYAAPSGPGRYSNSG